MLRESEPQWFLDTIQGLAGACDFSIYRETKRFAILKRAGNNSYVDRATGVVYCPVTFMLCRKGKNFWYGGLKDIHRGRAKKADIERMKKRLQLAEQKNTLEDRREQ